MVMLTGERAVVSTFAGGVNGTKGVYTDASSTNAGFNTPYGVTVDANGNLFVSDSLNRRIRKVTANGGTRLAQLLCLTQVFASCLLECICDIDIDVLIAELCYWRFG